MANCIKFLYRGKWYFTITLLTSEMISGQRNIAQQILRMFSLAGMAISLSMPRMSLVSRLSSEVSFPIPRTRMWIKSSKIFIQGWKGWPLRKTVQFFKFEPKTRIQEGGMSGDQTGSFWQKSRDSPTWHPFKSQRDTTFGSKDVPPGHDAGVERFWLIFDLSSLFGVRCDTI